jgi:hypothetical protein
MYGDVIQARSTRYLLSQQVKRMAPCMGFSCGAGARQHPRSVARWGVCVWRVFDCGWRLAGGKGSCLGVYVVVLCNGSGVGCTWNVSLEIFIR